MRSPAAPLFRSILGTDFDRLPDPVRRLHLRGTVSYEGAIVVLRGDGWLSRLCGWGARLPPAFDGPLRVDIRHTARGEVWTRHVRTHAMRSSLSAHRGNLSERLGPVRLWFRLSVDAGRLIWTVERVRVLGIPLPGRAVARVTAVESVEDGRYTFDVSASLPWVGMLVRYRGWLDVD